MYDARLNSDMEGTVEAGRRDYRGKTTNRASSQFMEYIERE